MSAGELNRFHFSVPFVAGKARPRFGRGHVYNEESTDDREEAIAGAYQAVSRGAKAEKDVPVALWIDVYKPLQKKTPKSVRSKPDTTKPDLDNVLKLVMDALNGKAWHDDRQVVSIRAERHMRTRNVQSHMEVFVAFPYQELDLYEQTSAGDIADHDDAR